MSGPAGRGSRSGPPGLALSGVGKRYGAVPALRGIDLEVRPGELVGLLGPNGAGKTSLMKIAAGLVRPTTGAVTVDGHSPRERSARMRTGYLAELFRLPPALTAEELLAAHQALAGSDGGTAERTRLLERCGIAAVRDRRIGTLSKGTQQRLGLAQALVGAPGLLLLDEPTSALDPLGRRAVRALLDELRAEGAAILLSSHLLTEIEHTCDRVVLLRGGDIIRSAATADLLRPTGVTVTTASGTRRFAGAEEADVARIVRELVAAGEDVLAAGVDVPTLEDAYAEAMAQP